MKNERKVHSKVFVSAQHPQTPLCAKSCAEMRKSMKNQKQLYKSEKSKQKIIENIKTHVLYICFGIPKYIKKVYVSFCSSIGNNSSLFIGGNKIVLNF